MEIVVIALLILLNGFFAMSEISLVSARRARLQRLIDAGDRGAQLAAELGAQPTKFLSTIQIGITSVGMLSAIMGAATLAPPLELLLVEGGLSEQLSRYLATGIVVALITYFSIVIGELVPKRIGQTHAEGIARFVARPIHFLAMLSKPFVVLLSISTAFFLRLFRVDDSRRSAVTEEEIHALLAEGSAAGVIEREEHRMVRNLFRLDDLKIVSLMTPRLDMVTLETTASIESVVAVLEQSPHTRYPVMQEGEDDILGVVSARELLLRTLRGEPMRLESAMQPPVFVPESISGMDLLESFRKGGDHLAFVINEYGGVLGLVTLHDLLEAITGSIQGAASDPQAWAIRRDDGSWSFDGHISMHQLLEHLGIEDSSESESQRHYQSLSGLFIERLGRLPHMGDRIQLDQWTLEIVDMDGRRIDRVFAVRDHAAGT